MDHRSGCNDMVNERASVLDNESGGIRASSNYRKHSRIQNTGLEEYESRSKDMGDVVHMDRIDLSFATMVTTSLKIIKERRYYSGINSRNLIKYSETNGQQEVSIPTLQQFVNGSGTEIREERRRIGR